MDAGHLPHDEDDALLRMVLAGGALAPRRALLQAFPTASDALRAGPGAWRAHGLDEASRQALTRPDATLLARCQAWLQGPRHALVGIHQPDYPPLLRQIAQPPLALFVDGDGTALWHPAVAIVGSRSPTAGGVDNADAFARGSASPADSPRAWIPQPMPGRWRWTG